MSEEPEEFERDGIRWRRVSFKNMPVAEFEQALSSILNVASMTLSEGDFAQVLEFCTETVAKQYAARLSEGPA